MYKFPKENILIVSGQEKENSISYDQGVKIVKVQYTGLHLTSAIYIHENIKKFKNIKYWVLLPDTIKFGELFFKKMMKYYNKYLKGGQVRSLPFINPKVRQTMDMGIVHRKHIINMGDYLNKIKISPPYNKEKLIQLKKQLIYDENTILGLSSNNLTKSTKFNNQSNSLQPTIFITNKKKEMTQTLINKNIQQVYFINIDLYKFQRNFHGPDAKLIMDL
jgi:hypothetical protein